MVKLSYVALMFYSAFALTKERTKEINCVCGNGIQEEFPQAVATCPFRLYGVTAPTISGASDLVALNTYDGTGTLIATITNIRSITGLDFSPEGILYAVGRNALNQSVLATVDCLTGVATIIGQNNAPSLITAINFDSQGRLWAYMNSVTNRTRLDGFLGRINIATGKYTDIGGTGLNQIGNGIGFSTFPVQTLYHAGGRYLSSLDQSTGVATILDPLAFFPPTHNRPRINDMDFDPQSNILYVSIADAGFGVNAPHENYLGAIDTETGAVDFVKIPPNFAPVGLSGIAVNRPYETCDQGGVPEDNPPLPDGTTCSLNCALVESNCSDTTDNDFDGLADCFDAECDGLACIAGDGCTEGDQCSGGTCVPGTPKDCDDFNDCTTDSCSLGVCLNEIDTNNSCTDFNSCTADTCDEFGFCQSEILPDNTPCDDESTCTIDDTCLEGQCIGAKAAEDCLNGIDDDCDELIDGDDPECAGAVTIEVECADGEDNDGDFLFDCEDPDCDGLDCIDDGNACTDDVCIFGFCDHPSDDTNSCDDNNPCTDDTCSIGTCIGTNDDSNLCDDENSCTLSDACIAGSCAGTPLACDDDNVCTEDFCAEGACSFSSLNGIACDSDDNQCTDDICDNGICLHVNDNTNTCNDELACTSADHCVAGICTGTKGMETGIASCSNGIDDDCDFLIDTEDPNCSTIWLRVFITKNTYRPDFGSAEAADALCQAAAISASRTGTFKAFVSSSTSDAASRILNPHNRPWHMYTTLAARIADNKTDLQDGTIQQAINVDEFGFDTQNPKFAWTGSNTDGTVALKNTCNDWTTDQANVKGTRGASDKIDYMWVNQPDATCNQGYRLYCFEIDTTP